MAWKTLIIIIQVPAPSTSCQLNSISFRSLSSTHVQLALDFVSPAPHYHPSHPYAELLSLARDTNIVHISGVLPA